MHQSLDTFCVLIFHYYQERFTFPPHMNISVINSPQQGLVALFISRAGLPVNLQNVAENAFVVRRYGQRRFMT